MSTERTPVNAYELHAIEYLAALDAQLIDEQKHLEKRLKSIPNGWRDFRCAAAIVQRVLDAVYETVPDKTLLHMQRLAAHGEVLVRVKPMVKPINDDMQIITNDDLKYLINTCMSSECAMCLKNAQEQKKCKLRKAMENNAVSNKIPGNGLCPYADVAAQSDLGDYIHTK